MAARAACGVLAYGTRRILPGSASIFKADFEAWAAGSGEAAAGLNAAFAFPDPADAELLHVVYWARGDLPGAGPASDAFASTPDDPDTIDVYGQGQLGDAGPAVRCNRNAPLAGFIRGPDDYPPAPAAGAGGDREGSGPPPPMIGIFKRAIKPGKKQRLIRAQKRRRARPKRLFGRVRRPARCPGELLPSRVRHLARHHPGHACIHRLARPGR